MKPLLRWMAPFAAMSALCACSLLVGKHEALTVYAPAPVRTIQTSRDTHDWQLLVAEPQAISPLNGARLVVLPQPGVIEFYKGTRWRDDAPVMLQELLVRAFQDSAHLTGVGTPSDNLQADFVLQSNLQEFQAEYRGAKTPTVAIRLSVLLVDRANGRTLASRSFVAEQACAGTDVPTMFTAFQSALDRLITEIVAWTIDNGDIHRNAKSPSAANGANSPAISIPNS